MKDKMIGFYRPSEQEFKEIWGDATIVIDANVLLNLYRYPANASQELLCSLEKLSERLWIPYHAALEYQLNRLTVIAEQKSRFSDVRKVIEDTKNNLKSKIDTFQLKKRHSAISVDEFIDNFDRLSLDFLDSLNKLEKNQMNISDEDQIRAKLDSVFLGRIGCNPFDQKKIDEIQREGEARYSIAMPPGYMDSKKEKTSEADSFQYGGLIYKRKFGDLILWNQLIYHARDASLKCIIFLTDDDKEDWWLIIDSQGKKRIGPRPELTEEIQRLAGIDKFYMYNSEQFLQFSKKYLKVDISDESIDQIRDIKEEISMHDEVFIEVTRICSECGQKFTVLDNERICSKCFKPNLK